MQDLHEQVDLVFHLPSIISNFTLQSTQTVLELSDAIADGVDVRKTLSNFAGILGKRRS